MKRKLAALISALAVTATMVPSFMVVDAASGDDLRSLMADYASVMLTEDSGSQYVWDTANNRIEMKNDAKISVTSDMKAKKSDVNDYRDLITNNTYSAGTTLNAQFTFDYKTQLNMSDVLSEFNKVTNLAKGAIEYEYLNNSPEYTSSKEELLAELDKSYIENAEFTVTIKNDNGMVIPDSAKTASDLSDFTAVNGSDVVTAEDGKIVITGDAEDAENGKLIYKQVSRTETADGGVEIVIETEGKTSHKALENALNYDLVLTCTGIGAVGPAAYGSEKVYKLEGTVTGNTPIYISTDPESEPIAYLEYQAVQDPSAGLFDSEDADKIAASVKVTTTTTPKPSNNGGTSAYNPPITNPGVSTPTPTITPTYAPDEIITPPAIFNADDHVAYIIGYPEGDVRPENNISREEVVTIFYRLLTDEARANLFNKTNDYTDVEDDRWSNNAISTMSKGGYVTGYEDGTFKPSAYITRAEFITIASRFYEAVVVEDVPFSDINGHWAKSYIEAGVFYRLISGYEDGTFRPDQYIKRSEAMKIVNSILNRCVTAEGLTEDAVSSNWIDNPESAWYYTEVLEATRTHDYTRPEGTLEETWTALNADPNWAEIERTWTVTGNEYK